jgi:hypothetical protein
MAVDELTTALMAELVLMAVMVADGAEPVDYFDASMLFERSEHISTRTNISKPAAITRLLPCVTRSACCHCTGVVRRQHVGVG